MGKQIELSYMERYVADWLKRKPLGVVDAIVQRAHKGYAIRKQRSDKGKKKVKDNGEN